MFNLFSKNISGYDLTGADTENFKDWNKNHIKGKWVEVKYPIYEHSNNNKNKNKNKNKDKNQSGYWNLHTEICYIINKWQEKIWLESLLYIQFIRFL